MREPEDDANVRTARRERGPGPLPSADLRKAPAQEFGLLERAPMKAAAAAELRK
jgi:hypothetical protein